MLVVYTHGIYNIVTCILKAFGVTIWVSRLKKFRQHKYGMHNIESFSSQKDIYSASEPMWTVLISFNNVNIDIFTRFQKVESS